MYKKFSIFYLVLQKDLSRFKDNRATKNVLQQKDIHNYKSICITVYVAHLYYENYARKTSRRNKRWKHPRF